MKKVTKLQRAEKRKYFIVHTLYPFKSLTVNGVPCSSPEPCMVWFMPVFSTREAAVQHNGGKDEGVWETSET